MLPCWYAAGSLMLLPSSCYIDVLMAGWIDGKQVSTLYYQNCILFSFEKCADSIQVASNDVCVASLQEPCGRVLERTFA